MLYTVKVGCGRWGNLVNQNEFQCLNKHEVYAALKQTECNKRLSDKSKNISKHINK